MALVWTGMAVWVVGVCVDGAGISAGKRRPRPGRVVEGVGAWTSAAAALLLVALSLTGDHDGFTAPLVVFGFAVLPPVLIAIWSYGGRQSRGLPGVGLLGELALSTFAMLCLAALLAKQAWPYFLALEIPLAALLLVRHHRRTRTR